MKNIKFIETLKKMPLMSLPVRTVVVESPQGTVILSPGSNMTAMDYQSLSNVTDIVATNTFHTAGLPIAHSYFPLARLWVPNRRSTNKLPGLTTHLLETTSWPHQESLALLPLDGLPAIREFAFFHKDSKSLIVTDLCFNMTTVSGLGSWIILSLFGTYRRLGVSRFFAKYITDRLAFEKSLTRVFSCDFENVIVSHGENILTNGKERLLNALAERDLFPK